MPVLGDASLYVNDYEPDEKWNVIIFSHGLGSNLNNYSAMCGWFATHGYIVVSIQHNHDRVRIEF
jgi:predicted dienelactone hydrolase